MIFDIKRYKYKFKNEIQIYSKYICKKFINYICLFKLLYCYCELNTGVAVGFVWCTKAAVSDGGGHEM